ncbi:MAG: hypothetical protein H7199_04145 [Burkholderiales bacterium]|nr:hypothetical protein [Flavobacterium sp.]
MKLSNPDRLEKNTTKIYFAITTILVIAELFQHNTSVLVFKPLLIPLLMALYFFTSKVKNIFYLLSLFFAWGSNIFLLSSAQEFLLYGILTFMVYRILTIVVVVRLIGKQPFLPFIIACAPFLFIFSCLINLTMSSLSTSFYPAIVNGILISILAGISLSNYIMDDNRVNFWLALSTLFAVVLVFLFTIQKYYLTNGIFQPMSALIFAVMHYTFYKFVLEAERIKNSESLNSN